jgi:hypothetical protein
MGNQKNTSGDCPYPISINPHHRAYRHLDASALAYQQFLLIFFFKRYIVIFLFCAE